MSDYRDLPLFAGLRGGERITINGETYTVYYLNRVTGELKMETDEYRDARLAARG